MSQRKKFITLFQLHPEAGVDFDNLLTYEVHKKWAQALQSTLKPEGLMLTKYQGYQLDIWIAASTKIADLNIKGPGKGRKNKYIEYFLWIPHASIVSSSKSFTKLTEYFRQGVKEVLQKLEYSEESISNTLEAIG